MSALGSFNHILIIKPSSLGDIVHCFPVVDQIRKTFPDASIDWVANTEFLPLVRRYPGVRRGIAFPRSRWGKVSFFPSFGRFLQDLRQESYDAVLDAQGLLRSALIARGSRGAIRIGFSDAREGAVGLYSEVISLDGTSGILHAVRKNLRLLEPLGIAPEYSLQRLTYSAQDQENLEKILLRASADFQGNFFVLHPGAKRSIKRWPSLYFSDLLNAIHRHYPGIRPVLVGGSGRHAASGRSGCKDAHQSGPPSRLGPDRSSSPPVREGPLLCRERFGSLASGRHGRDTDSFVLRVIDAGTDRTIR